MISNPITYIIIDAIGDNHKKYYREINIIFQNNYFTFKKRTKDGKNN